MKRSRFSEEQIIAVLKEQEAGMPTAEVCRRHGISSATFYKWKSKFGGLEVSDARRLRNSPTSGIRSKIQARRSSAFSARVAHIGSMMFSSVVNCGTRRRSSGI